MTASGRHLRTEYGLLSRCTIHVARCTPALDSSGPCSRTKLLHDVGCSASERSCESMGERQGKTSSVEPKCVVPVLGLASVLVLVLVLGGARPLRSQIRLRPHNTGPRQREGEGGREDSRRVSTLLLGVWIRRERMKEKKKEWCDADCGWGGRRALLGYRDAPLLT